MSLVVKINVALREQFSQKCGSERVNADEALCRIKTHKNCIKIHQNDLVQKDLKCVKNLNSKLNKK